MTSDKGIVNRHLRPHGRVLRVLLLFVITVSLPPARQPRSRATCYRNEGPDTTAVEEASWGRVKATFR